MSWVSKQAAVLCIAAASVCAAETNVSVQSITQALRSGNNGEAKRLCEDALKTSPNDPRLWVLDGMAVAKLGDNRQALVSYQHALQISPEYLPALEGAAEIEFKQGNQSAVPLLQQIIKVHPSDRTTHAMLGALAFQRGDCKAAAAEFEQSHPLIDSQIPALQEAGSCLVKLGRAADALPVFQTLVQLENASDKARYNLATVQCLAGKYADAQATLIPLANASKPDPDVLDLLAEAYEATGDTPKAVEALHRAIVTNPDVARYYVDFANLSLTHASYQVGADMLTAGLKRLPEAAPLYIARGILYVQLGQYGKSQSDFDRAEMLDPKGSDASSASGMAALQQNNLERAETVVREQLGKQPNDPFLHYLLAETLTRRGASVGSPQFKEALAAAAKAVQLKPDFGLARDVLGRLYLEEGRTGDAIRESRLAVQEQPEDQSALYHLILALRRTNRTEEVPALLKQLTKLRQSAHTKENNERKYALVEQTAGETP